MMLTFTNGNTIDTNRAAAIHNSAVKVAETIRKRTLDKLKNEKCHVTFIEELALYMPSQFEVEGITWWRPMSNDASVTHVSTRIYDDSDVIRTASLDKIICYANALVDPNTVHIGDIELGLGLNEIFTEEDIAEYVEGFILRPHLLFCDLYNYTDTWDRSEVQEAMSEKSYFRSIDGMLRTIEFSILPSASTKDIEKLLVRTMINSINQKDPDDIIARICGMAFDQMTFHVRLSGKKSSLGYKLRTTVNTRILMHTDIYDLLATYTYPTPTLTIAVDNEDGDCDKYGLYLPFIAAGPRTLPYTRQSYANFINDFNNMMSNETVYKFLCNLISRLVRRYDKSAMNYLDLSNYPQIIRPEPEQDANPTKKSTPRGHRRIRATKRVKYEFDDMNIEPANEETTESETETATD